MIAKRVMIRLNKKVKEMSNLDRGNDEKNSETWRWTRSQRSGSWREHEVSDSTLLCFCYLQRARRVGKQKKIVGRKGLCSAFVVIFHVHKFAWILGVANERVSQQEKAKAIESLGFMPTSLRTRVFQFWLNVALSRGPLHSKDLWEREAEKGRRGNWKKGWEHAMESVHAQHD